MENVKLMIRVMEKARVNALSAFNAKCADLLTKYIEAKDNVKFLNTLERHFKNISSGNLTIMAETIPSMMKLLRHVWIISRHYNKDHRMFPLMEMIAREIAEKVANKISIAKIFRLTPKEVLQSALLL